MMVQIDLHCRLQDTHCQDADDIRAHFDTLLCMWEELFSMGTTLADMDFSAIALSSLPNTYNTVLSSMLSAAQISGKTLDPLMIIAHITEEYDRRQIQACLSKSSDGTAQKNTHGARGQRKTCTNCSGTGHTVNNCWHQGGGKEGQWLKGWGPNSRQDREKDSRSSAHLAAALSTNFTFAVISDNPKEDGMTCCLDTGASHHYSPFWAEFINFCEIEPKPVIAADKHIFYATGRGDVIVNFPNDHSMSRIKLTDVLYMLTIVFMLISISRIDHSSFSTIFRDGSCQLRSPTGELITCILRVDNLYKFECPADARAALVLISIAPPESVLLTLLVANLHHRLGHMSLEAAKCLIRHGAIIGIDLDQLATEAEACTACIQAKITHVPFPKERTRPRSITYGKLVSSNLWGPAQTDSIKGEKYVMTMLDDASYEVLITFLKAKSEALESTTASSSRFNTMPRP
ncbi:hypothetical protein EWM64_g9176 [Hericium alpestre]|uniref:Retrovirus-related Pol polyprotein from transposon TNT 1-94-like beta-barrel domain-containing protein n=1 Tax=Hericium alpestre TaxID=135208 RepID=A0A4Y9ZJ55_9AGAM|nr:hypothetical protein EWM64_g9176 [Hericium alpestre]